jgi:hypothetical protein
MATGRQIDIAAEARPRRPRSYIPELVTSESPYAQTYTGQQTAAERAEAAALEEQSARRNRVRTAALIFTMATGPDDEQELLNALEIWPADVAAAREWIRRRGEL